MNGVADNTFIQSFRRNGLIQRWFYFRGRLQNNLLYLRRLFAVNLLVLRRIVEHVSNAITVGSSTLRRRIGWWSCLFRSRSMVVQRYYRKEPDQRAEKQKESLCVMLVFIKMDQTTVHSLQYESV